MSIPDRIILTLYTILMAVVAVLIIIVSLGIIPPTTLADYATNIPGSWQYAIAGVIILLVSLRLLVAGLGGTGSNALTIENGKEGKIHVSQGAMEDYVAGFTKLSKGNQVAFQRACQRIIRSISASVDKKEVDLSQQVPIRKAKENLEFILEAISTQNDT